MKGMSDDAPSQKIVNTDNSPISKGGREVMAFTRLKSRASLAKPQSAPYEGIVKTLAYKSARSTSVVIDSPNGKRSAMTVENMRSISVKCLARPTS